MLTRMSSPRPRLTADSACTSHPCPNTGNHWTWCCEHAASDDFQRAVRLLQPHLPVRNLSGRCCALRPAEVHIRCSWAHQTRGNVAVRVWPGAEGASLFALQVHSVTGNDVLARSNEDPLFEVSLPSGTTVRLRGMADYGTASYCAALGQALGLDDDDVTHPLTRSAPAAVTFLESCSSPEKRGRAGPVATGCINGAGSARVGTSAMWPAQSSSTKSNASEWIDVLLSAADLMEGGPLGTGGTSSSDGADATAYPKAAVPGAPCSAPPGAVRVTALLQRSAAPQPRFGQTTTTAGGAVSAHCVRGGSGPHWALPAAHCNAQLLNLLGLPREPQSLRVPYVGGPEVDANMERLSMLEIMDVTDLRAMELGGFLPPPPVNQPPAAATKTGPTKTGPTMGPTTRGGSRFRSSHQEDFALAAADAPQRWVPRSSYSRPLEAHPAAVEVEVMCLSASQAGLRGLPYPLDWRADTLGWDDSRDDPLSGLSTDSTDMFGVLYGNDAGLCCGYDAAAAGAEAVHAAGRGDVVPDCTCTCGCH